MNVEDNLDSDNFYDFWQLSGYAVVLCHNVRHISKITTFPACNYPADHIYFLSISRDKNRTLLQMPFKHKLSRYAFLPTRNNASVIIGQVIINQILINHTYVFPYMICNDFYLTRIQFFGTVYVFEVCIDLVFLFT